MAGATSKLGQQLSAENAAEPRRNRLCIPLIFLILVVLRTAQSVALWCNG